MPMTLFLVIGVVGVALVLVSLIFGDLLEIAADGLGALFSAEVLGAFLGALGFAGAITLSLTDSVVAAAAAGAATGAGIGGLAWWASRRLRRGDHSGTVRTSDLIEQTGKVLAPIPRDGLGVVSLSVGGHLTRVNATSDTPIPSGTEVVVVAVLSATKVAVVPLFDS